MAASLLVKSEIDQEGDIFIGVHCKRAVGRPRKDVQLIALADDAAEQCSVKQRTNTSWFHSPYLADVLDAVQEVYALVGRSKDKQFKLEDIKVFEFIAHYELGNSELLQYTVRNNQRYFKDHQPDNAFIETLWKLFKQFIQSAEKPKKAKQQLKEQIQVLECPAANVALKDEVVAWLGV